MDIILKWIFWIFVLLIFVIFIDFVAFGVAYLLSLFNNLKTRLFDIIFKSYGYVNNKKISKKSIPMFRDIPCNKDIYYANVLIKLNNFGYKKNNIIGAILLKWIKQNKVVLTTKKIRKYGMLKEVNVIDLSNGSNFDNEIEDRLYLMMWNASKDGKLETKEFEKWCVKNYFKFKEIFNNIEDESLYKLRRKYYIYTSTSKKECKYKNVMNDIMYNDSVKLYGLKKYLDEFSRIDVKELKEIHMWDEYLMFAYLFGIADKVLKQLKRVYPDVLEQVNYDALVMMGYISSKN